MENKIKKVMSLVFKVDLNDINHEFSPNSIDNWDSLSHMNLIVALEEEFNIEFETEEISKLMDFKQILEVISSK